MTDHPITPPPEVVEQWIKHYGNSKDPRWQAYEQDIATQAAQWGYDQAIKELEAFLEKGNDNAYEAHCEALAHRLENHWIT